MRIIIDSEIIIQIVDAAICCFSDLKQIIQESDIGIGTIATELRSENQLIVAFEFAVFVFGPFADLIYASDVIDMDDLFFVKEEKAVVSEEVQAL